MSDIFRDFDKKNEVPKVKLNLPKFDFSHLTEAARNMNSAFENMTRDIRERQDNAMAMEFTKSIGELLRKNGVTPKITEYAHENVKEHSIEQLYGVSIDELDFSEHDKVFEDKIELLNRNLNLQKDKRCEEEIERNYLAGRFSQLKSENDELKQRIAELESKETSELPFDPLECANYLINATYERETNTLERGLKGLPEKVDSDRYTIDDLEQIAEHLLVYCKHNKDFEEDGK